MENTNDPDHMDKILLEMAGIRDDNMSSEERQRLLKVLKQSHQESSGGSSLSKSQEDKGSMPKEENLFLFQELKAGNALGNKVNHNFPNHGNTSLPLMGKEVPKEFHVSRNVCYSAAVSRLPVEKAGVTITFKSSPEGPVTVRNNELDLNSSYQANTSSSNDNVWLEAGKNNKENGTFTKRSASPSKEETKPEETTPKETENTSTKDNVNTLRGENKDRESSENFEVLSLMHLVFKKRNPTSFYLEKPLLPPLSLSKEEWLCTVYQNLFARKVAKIETCGSRWITLLERSSNIASLEKAVAKSSPQHTKDDGNTNFSESIQNSPKARSPPENIVDDVREDSPDVVAVESSPKRDSVNSEGVDNAAIALPDSSKKEGKIETPVNSPAGRNDCYGSGEVETGRKKNSRNRGRKGRGGSRPNTSNDDISNGAQSSSVVGKNSDTDFTASNWNSLASTSTGGNSPAYNNAEDKLQCPMCEQIFNVFEQLQRHAWECNGATAEGENQVAENGGKSDAAESKRRKLLFPIEDDDEELQIIEKKNSVLSEESEGDEGDDNVVGRLSTKFRRKCDNGDDDFVTRNANSNLRKRNQVSSDDEDTPSKSSRK